MRLIFVIRFNGRFQGNLFEQFIEGLLRKFKYISNVKYRQCDVLYHVVNARVDAEEEA